MKKNISANTINGTTKVQNLHTIPVESLSHSPLLIPVNKSSINKLDPWKAFSDNSSTYVKEVESKVQNEQIILSKRKIREITVDEYANAMQKLVESKIVVREKCIKIISRSTGNQIGWRIKKEYEDGSKSNDAKYFN